MRDRITVLEDPGLEETGNLLINARAADAYTTILGQCRVEYDGRASSTLGFGDRHVTLQPDGCVRVDTDTARKPVNWQPPGAEYTARMTDEETLHIHAKRTGPTETLDIEFTNVYFITATEMDDEAEFSLVGTEQDMQDHIMSDPTPISKALDQQFIPKEAEHTLDVGSVDVFGETDTGETVVVELKRKHVGPDAVDQLLRYVTDIEEQDGTRPIGVLVSPSLTDSARTRMDEQGFIHVPFTPDETELTVDRPKDSKLSEYYTD